MPTTVYDGSACVCCDEVGVCACQACPVGEELGTPPDCELVITFAGFENCGPIAGAVEDGIPYVFSLGGSGWTRQWSHDYGTHVSLLDVTLTCISSTEVQLSFVWTVSTTGFSGSGTMTATMGGGNTCEPVNISFPAGSYVSGAGTEPGCSLDIANFEALVTA
jgi:hypothetical protein